MTESFPMNPQERRHAEMVLLGSLFLHPETGVALRHQLRPEDFSEEPHCLIYETLTTVLDSPELVTVDAISTLLTPDELARVGGVPYLAFLLQQAENATMPIGDQVQLLKQAALQALLAQAVGVQPALTGLSTGFADLDTITGGLQRSDLVIVAGPPSIGKTSFALSIALHALLAVHCSVGLFSLEAPMRQVIRRLLLMEDALDEQLLRSVESEEGQQSGEGSAASQAASLWIDDTSNLSTAELARKAHLLYERANIQLLIVDYVHLMLSSVNDKRHENRVQEVGEISRSLKALARELDIPVLALAQVSRAFEGRPSKKLQLSDLRDGSLENDADLVLFLSVSEADTTVSANSPRLATISIAKHRHGPRADLDICYLPASTRFCDLQTLPPSLAPERSATAPPPSSQRAKDFPRLQEIMARIRQGGQTPSETGYSPTITPAQSSRSLPIGSVLEDEEA